MSLGRQCLQCKKRRVKCGSEEPGCGKCDKDGFLCPGYTKVLRWVEVRPRDSHFDFESVVSLGPPGSRRSLPASRIFAEPTNVRTELIRQTRAPALNCVISRPSEVTTDFMRAVHYFNTEMLRDLSATYWQSRNSFRAQQWSQVPEILRSMLVVSVLMTQSIRSGTNPPQIYKYRSHVIKDLKDYLQRQSEQTPTILLALTLADRIEEQYRYVAAFDNFETDLLDSPLPCPLPLFLLIIRVNKLRSLSISSSDTTTSAWAKEWFEIVRSAHEFDAVKWSNNLPCLPGEDAFLTAATEWANLASCYRGAIIVYLIESAKSQAFLEKSNLVEISNILLNCAQQHLHSSLRQLFESYPVRQTTAEQPTLWRAVQWPLMVHAYQVVVLGEEWQSSSMLLGAKSESLTLSQELEEIGKLRASRGILDGVAHFNDIAKRGESWSWDEVFEQSLIFYL
ncbi:hypothetical protein LTR17_019719 [Elasticomyces elasticus]|nr:hypothetical protein LTR17_019719 [Elasticomyces elasticus]